MYGKKLTDQEIRTRLVEGSNYKYLYTQLKVRFDEAKAGNKALRADNQELRQLLTQALEQNKTQAIQIAELQQMVFGQKEETPNGRHAHWD